VEEERATAEEARDLAAALAEVEARHSVAVKASEVGATDSVEAEAKGWVAEVNAWLQEEVREREAVDWASGEVVGWAFREVDLEAAVGSTRRPLDKTPRNARNYRCSDSTT
jgi:hypothetical protein